MSNRGLIVNCFIFLSDFDQNRNVSTNFNKNLEYEFSRKIRPEGVVLLHVYGGTDGQTRRG
jgi:hypothetical protein